MNTSKAGKRKPPHPQAEIRASQTGSFLTLHEIVKKARQRMDDENWDYLMGGTETETTMHRNRMALDAIAFTPRVLRDVSAIDCSASFFGQKLRIPVLLAPVGMLERFDPDGAAASAKACAEFGIAHMLSSRTAPELEDVAAAGDNMRLFQLYTRGDWDWIEDYIKRAKDNGFSAFCMTVDSAYYSRRERVLARGHITTFRSGIEGFIHQTQLNWDTVKRFKETHPDFPLIIKGIATAEDATLAIEHGVDGIYISNHGGRQLDHGRGAIETLPEIVDAANGQATIIIDGGFCRGSDIVKAVIMGADVVGLGKLQGLALAAGGAPGVVRMLEILEKEIITCLGLIGASSFDELDPKAIILPAKPATEPHATSAFPLLNLTSGTY